MKTKWRAARISMVAVNYPDAYLALMREVMGQDYAAWTAAQDAPLFRVIRLNLSKISVQSFMDEFPDALRLENYPGYLFQMPVNETSLGNHPFHHAGCFYIQEPSASLSVEALLIEKGDKILDCCAAPGGKSTQILSQLDASGFLVSNEIDAKRNQTLRFNLQRFGDDNLLIIQNDTAVIGQTFRGYFDKILVDAPCSGTGMFRKEPAGIQYFSQKNIDHCVRMQKDILENVYPALKENGIMVYSTCTFTLEENELQIKSFIQRHPDMVIEELPFSIGRNGISPLDAELSKCRRITLLEGGEGHFICRMRKTGKESIPRVSILKPSLHLLVQNSLASWIDTTIPYYQHNGHIYLSKNIVPSSENLHITQIGVYLGDIVKGRIDPEHAFATSKIASDHFMQRLDVTKDQISAYLCGETLSIKDIKGFVLITYKHQTVGLGKGDGNVIKNHFPKGIRSFQKFSEKSK